jgi:hypothetical protein
MFNPIIKQTKKKKSQELSMSKETFEKIVKEVYNIMLAYGNIQGKVVTKDSPIFVGNVRFWFETEKDTQKTKMRFSPSAYAWNEKAIEMDIENHLHDLFYNTSAS